MRHLDEHTMAFYAMGAEFPSSEKNAIESHLIECHGCRAQVEEMREIDQHVAETIDSAGSSDDLPSDALARLPKPVMRQRDDPPVRLNIRTVTRRARFTALVRRHPLGAGSAGLALAFLAFFSFNTIAHLGRKAEQPLFVKINQLGTAVEVYGKETKIFDIPINLPSVTPGERERLGVQLTRIADLFGDGNMEVLSGSPYLKDGRNVGNVLRIYSSTGDLISSWSLGDPARYNGVDYTGSYGISGLLVTSPMEGAGKDILVGMNNDRSPWVLMHLNNKGRTLGEYWHFGWLIGMVTINLPGVDHDLVLLTGVNDADYRSNDEFPAMTVLDPARIVGSTEATCTRGFGFAATEAEVYYVRTGNVDKASVSGVKVEAATFGFTPKVGSDSSFMVMEGFKAPADFPKLMYTFNEQANLQNVSMDDDGRVLLIQKYLTVKTPEGFDGFTKEMERKVEYWNGSHWTSERTRVIHTLPPS